MLPSSAESALRLGLLCWEGYDASSVLEPFCHSRHVSFTTQTLLSDAQTACDLTDGSLSNWDVLNINNAYVKDYLHPRGLIDPLNKARFEQSLERSLGNWSPEIRHLYDWTRSDDDQLLGICQRFGAFNFVVNTRRIDVHSAEDQGFQLANDTAMTDRFGILKYDDFNIFHICLAADINPFVPLNNGELDAYSVVAQRWHSGARIVTDDHHRLNRALLAGDIDFYNSGGVYTVSPVRMEGHHHLAAITPASGPVDGKGAIAFAEITSCLANSNNPSMAMDFIEYLLQPDTAVRVASVSGTCNPVAQMGNPAVLARFDKHFLESIQWQSLEEDISRCVHYQLVPDHAELLRRLREARATRRAS